MSKTIGLKAGRMFEVEASTETRRATQIATQGVHLVALCDDGTIWRLPLEKDGRSDADFWMPEHAERWHRLVPIPQEPVEP